MTLPAWLEPLPDAAQMRAIDEWAIEQRRVPSLELMERAGGGLARVVDERVPEGRIAVVCGKGNNGGDGLVAARVLRQQGRDVAVLCVERPEDFQGDPRANLARLPGPAPAVFSRGGLDGAAVIVDAIFGTGFTGAPREPVTGVIEAINAAAAEVVAADVPSGVDASTGEVDGVAVCAQATTTFHAAKLGLWVMPGKEHAGEVRVVDIGIPDGAPVESSAGLIHRAVLDLVPRRLKPATKFREGAVVVAGGSTGLTGAPSLAGEAAARAGAGYVTACVPASLNMVFEIRLLEAMTRPLSDRDGSLTPDAVDGLLQATERADALVLGPGLGREEGALAFAREAAARAPRPLLLDADGLNAHAGRLAELAGRSEPTLLTPHAGELGRLLDTSSAEVEAHRVGNARAAAHAAGAIVVLKGDDTLVVRPDGLLAVNPGGSPALATAGTGDVLSGVIGAFLAKGVEPFAAACAGVYLHGAAGRRAAASRGPDGVIARDVIEALPRARAEPD